jgi:hypothetical protein
MSPIWKRRRDPIEAILWANRPEPDKGFAALVLAKLERQETRSNAVAFRRRVLAVGLVTALAAAGAVAAGGASAVSSSISGLVQVADHGVNGNPQGNGQQAATTTADTTTATATTTPAVSTPDSTTTAATTTAATTTASTTTATTTTTTTTSTAAATTPTPTTTSTAANQSNGGPATPTNTGTVVNNGSTSNSGEQGESPGDRQYAVTVCHHTDSATNPWVELTVSQQGAANLVAHDPPDFIVGPGSPCPPT